MRESFEDTHELDELLSSPELASQGGGEPAAEPAPEPIGFVTRSLTGPDGSSIEVEVPVYAASEGTADLPDESEAEQTQASDEPVHQDLSELLAAEDAD